ncbi:MAG TPA: ABC transporter ATP-binding protein [Gemmatimonadaceae bacterium]
MSAYAIQASGLGKSYRLGAKSERHDTLRDLVGNAIKAPFRNFRSIKAGSSGPAGELFWALRDVSFEVKHGEVLGVIGRNGAGKSTLLKVLSRITEPTTGRAVVEGRVGSLLEVGTGFHPELTGRENVFLNGSILGMDRAYIERRFDEIVEFAGVERFIDTVVKRYSSGMYLRLAFAVAAHLEPEVLIVDEVLAVGDAEFQRKCVGKMSEVAGHGRTVLFVSHNMGAITKLCQRAIVMSAGQKVYEGTARDAVQAYLAAGAQDLAEREFSDDEGMGDDTVRLRRVRVVQDGDEAVARVDMMRPFAIEMEYEARTRFPELDVHMVLHNDEGDYVLQSTLSLGGEGLTQTAPGRYVVRCELPAGALNAGHYWVGSHGQEPYIRWPWGRDRLLRFEVEQTSPQLARYQTGFYHGSMGPLLPRWSRRQLAGGATGADGR